MGLRVGFVGAGQMAEALAKVHDLGAKYGSDMSDSVVRKAKAHAADQREHIKRLEKEVHMLNSKGRMLEVQCDMLQQQEEPLSRPTASGTSASCTPEAPFCFRVRSSRP